MTNPIKNYFPRDNYSKFLKIMEKSHIAVDEKELTKEHLAPAYYAAENYSIKKSSKEVSVEDRKTCYNKNKNNSFLTEPKIKIHGWHDIPDLESLEEITKTRHPSIQDSYLKKSKIEKYNEGLLKHSSGIEKIIKNPLIINLPKDVIKKTYTYLTNEDQSKIDIIFETNMNRYLVNYRATNTLKGRKKSINNLEFIKDILNFEHVEKNTTKIYVSGEDLNSEIIQ